MRKQSKKEKKHAKRRAESELKKRRRRKRYEKRHNRRRNRKSSGSERVRFQPFDHRIRLSGALDLIDNPAHTRSELSKLSSFRPHPPHSIAKDEIRLWIDLKRIDDIDACALLYLVNQISRLSRLGYVWVSGNFPAQRQARQAFRDAKFFEWVTTGHRQSKGEDFEIFSSWTSVTTDPKNHAALARFILKNVDTNEPQLELPLLDTFDLESLHNAFTECIENVQDHAYGTENGPWSILGLRSTGRRGARAVIADCGIGIPKSVKLNWAQQSARNIPGLDSLLKADDWTLLQAATQGKKTRTDEYNRGNGLNEIRKKAIETTGAALHVHSGSSAITWDGEKEPSRQELPFLEGTVVCLEV